MVSWRAGYGNDGLPDTAKGAFLQAYRLTGAPLAKPDKARTISGRPVTIPVLANDIDPDDGDVLTVVAANAGRGDAVINGDGSVIYMPDGSCQTSDVIDYTIRDGAGLTSSSKARIAVGLRPVLGVTGSNRIILRGPAGGPFTGAGDLAVSNVGCADLEWEANGSEAWIALPPTRSGTLGPAASAVVSVGAGPGADSLPPGTYSGAVTIRNRTNGTGNARRPVYLLVE